MTRTRPGPRGLAVHRSGEGPLLVLVHGTMDRSSSFGRVSRLLSDFRIVRYDRRGYGHSAHLGPPESFVQQVDDLLAVVADEPGAGPAVVFGHSYGGTIALAAAARPRSGIGAVVAYESPMPWADWWPGDSAGAAAVAASGTPADAAERFMRAMVSDERWERLPPSTREARRAEGPTMVAELSQIRPPNPPGFDPAAIAVPVIAAHGTLGAPHHRLSMEMLARDVPGARLHIVDGAGHGVHLGDPAAVAALVRQAQGVAAPS